MFREIPTQRAHFSIFVPSATDSTIGSVIHVIGAPMAGYKLQFKRRWSRIGTKRRHEMIPIGEARSSDIVDSPEDAPFSEDTTPQGNIEVAASLILAPGRNENFLAPVNDTTNRRCQEWTMEYVRHLVALGIIATDAIEAVQAKRDPPSHGITLRPVRRD
ncbi:unnamed protein product [Penicillium bialowiezense]